MIKIIASIFLLLSIVACDHKNEEVKVEISPKREVTLMSDISGVWASPNSGMMTLNYRDSALQFVLGDVPLIVRLGAIDAENETANLLLTHVSTGKEIVWTLRRIWNKEKTSFHLELILDDGSREEWSFVRKISIDDLNRLANLNARTGESGGSVKQSIEKQDLSPQQALSQDENIIAVPPMQAPTLASTPIPAPTAVSTAPLSMTRDQAVDSMLENYQDKLKLLQAKVTLDAADKPSPGDKKIAREKNAAGLAALKIKDSKLAIELFRDGRKADPSDVEVSNNYAFALEVDDQNDLAEQAAKEALILDASRGAPWFTMAKALAKKGQADRAVAAFANSNFFSKAKDKNLETLVKLAATSDNEKVKQAAARAIELPSVKTGTL